MNEIIRSIWDKAAIALKDVELGRTENRARLMEKFSELLIYECAKVADAAIDHRHGCVSWPSTCIFDYFKVDTE